MRSKKIEEMKLVSTEYLKQQGYHIENGTLKHAGLEEVNGLAVVDVTIEFDDGACSMGSLTAGQFNPTYKTICGSRYGCEALLWLMAVAGVDYSEDLVGSLVRVAFDKDDYAKFIGHIVKDRWFSFNMLAEGIREEEQAAKDEC